MKIKILGISGSPRDGNTKMMVEEALKAASKIPDVECSQIDLKGKISPCIDCDKCPVNPPQRHCQLNDKMEKIFPSLIEADGIILGSPVYANTVSAQTKAFMDRCRPIVREGMLLRYKVGGAIAVGGGRHAGQEKAISTIIDFYLIHGMYPVGLPLTLQIGAAGLAWRPKAISDDRWFWQYQGSDITAFDEARQLGSAVALMSKVIKAGLEVFDPRKYIEVFKINRNMKKLIDQKD